MAYATEKQLKKANDLGFSYEKSVKMGHTFNKKSLHIWAIREGWQTAFLRSGFYINHKIYKTLERALGRLETI